MSWDADGGGGDWNSGPATHDNFTIQDARSGFDNSGDANAIKGYGDGNGYGNTNGRGDINGSGGADGGHGGGNDGACFSCGEQGQDSSLPISALLSLTALTHSHMKSDCPNPRVPREGGGACFNCGQDGSVLWLPISAFAILTTSIPQPYEIRLPEPSRST